MSKLKRAVRPFGIMSKSKKKKTLERLELAEKKGKLIASIINRITKQGIRKEN